VVQQVLGELGVGDRPVLNVLNKADLLVNSPAEIEATGPEARTADSVVVSAAMGWNIAEVIERIEAMLERGYQRVRVRIPYRETALVDLFHRKGTVDSERHTEEGTVITGSLPERYTRSFQPFLDRRK
jgi:GTPase